MTHSLSHWPHSFSRVTQSQATVDRPTQLVVVKIEFDLPGQGDSEKTCLVSVERLRLSTQLPTVKIEGQNLSSQLARVTQRRPFPIQNNAFNFVVKFEACENMKPLRLVR